MKRSKARVLLHECCYLLPIPAHVLNNLKTIVIKYVYGSKELGCAETWATQSEKMKKKSMQRSRSIYIKSYLLTSKLSCILPKELFN